VRKENKTGIPDAASGIGWFKWKFSKKSIALF